MKTRRTYSRAEEVLLLAQVEGVCPLCGRPLHYKKNGKLYKDFELAHVYPLNPRGSEEQELLGVERLSADVNDPDNIIPLCKGCHGRFDKPRSRAEYEDLAAIKQAAVKRLEQQQIQVEYPIESEIARILTGLQGTVADSGSVELIYDPKKLDTKLTEDVPPLLIRKLKHCVRDYYPYINNQLKEFERDSPSSSDLICAQVRTFYLRQKALGVTQAEAFENIVSWITNRANEASREAGEAVVSYFVQHCEVFE